MSEISVTFCKAEEYLTNNSFDLYVVNEYTRELVKDKTNVLEVSRSDMGMIDTFLEAFKRKQATVFAIGAGTVVDVVKYICFKTDSIFHFIPSALSTNSFATHRNSFFDRDHGKISFDSAVASKIIVDFDLLKQAYILNRFGLVEIASTVTAQIDCDIASKLNGAIFDTTLRGRAQKLAEEASALLLEQHSEESLRRLLNLLLESGELTRLQGNGRLVSGTEHIISSYIEGEYTCPHGMGLMFGIMIAQELHAHAGYNSELTNTIVKRLKSDRDMRKYIESTITQDQIGQVLMRVRPRKDKFTVLDLLSPDQFMYIAKDAISNYFTQQ